MPKVVTLAVDLGGTGIKMGLIERSGALHRVTRFATPVKKDARSVAELICANAKLLLKARGDSRVVGVGVGSAGDVDPVAGVIRVSPNLGWKNVPLRKMLESHLKTPVRLENDANAAAWAAYVVEAKRKIPNLLCVTLGTGIGGGIVVNHSLYRGTTGSAGEIGHMTLYPEGIPCPCGNTGCLERYIGARAMREAAQQALAKGQRTMLRDLSGGDPMKIDPLLIAHAARLGDTFSKLLWTEAGERLGIGLASIVNILNPQWIVLSGGLSRAAGLLLEPMRRVIHQRAFATPARAMKIIISKLDQDLGIVGAGLLAFEPR